MTDEEKFRFDLSGFLVRPAILERDEVDAIVEQIERIHHNPESLPPEHRAVPGGAGECPDRPSEGARCFARNHRTRCPIRELFFRLA